MNGLNCIIDELPDMIPIIFDYFIYDNDIFCITNFKFICKKVFELTHNHPWFGQFKKTFVHARKRCAVSLDKKIFVVPYVETLNNTKKDFELSILGYLIELSISYNIVLKNLLLDPHIDDYDISRAFFRSCDYRQIDGVKYILDHYPYIDIHEHDDIAFREAMIDEYDDIIELLIITSFKQKKYYKFNRPIFNYDKKHNNSIIYNKVIEAYEKHGIEIQYKN
jgi:hypothetical protein